MDKKSFVISEALVALLILVIVVLVLISYGPKTWDLIKTSIGIGESNLGEEPISIEEETKINGELGAVAVIKMEDTLAEIKPTLPGYCLIATTLKNTGDKAWTKADNVKATLYCRHAKNNNLILAQNFPILQDHVTDLKPGEEIVIGFPGAPNNCIGSFDKYTIVLYFNCRGKGTIYEPCDNFHPDNPYAPKILDKIEFRCTG